MMSEFCLLYSMFYYLSMLSSVHIFEVIYIPFVIFIIGVDE